MHHTDTHSTCHACMLCELPAQLKAITMKTGAGSRCPSAGDGKADERIAQGRSSCSRKGHSIPSRPADASPRTRPRSAAAMVRPPKIGCGKRKFLCVKTYIFNSKNQTFQDPSIRPQNEERVVLGKRVLQHLACVGQLYRLLTAILICCASSALGRGVEVARLHTCE